MRLHRTPRLWVALLLTTGFFFAELVVGQMTKSTALLADSFHMLSDILSFIIALYSIKIAKRTFSNRNTYGWVRTEVLGALVNAVFQLALCFSIATEAVTRFFEIEEIENPKLLLIIGCGGLGINIIGLILFHEHSGISMDVLKRDKARKSGQQATESPVVCNTLHLSIIPHAEKTVDGKDYDSVPINDLEKSQLGFPVVVGQQSTSDLFSCSQDRGISENAPEFNDSSRSLSVDHRDHHHGHDSKHLNMQGVFVHILGDALGSIAVVISALISWLSDWKYKAYVDPCISLIIVIILMVQAVPIVRKAAFVLLQGVPEFVNMNLLRQHLSEVKGVREIHDLHVWQLADDKIIASLHISCNEPNLYMDTAASLKRCFHKHGIHSTTIQPEFSFDETNEKACLLGCAAFHPSSDCSGQACCDHQHKAKS